MLVVSAPEAPPDADGPVGDQLCATHLRVAARLIPFIGDEVEHLLGRSVDADLAFDADPAAVPPSFYATVLCHRPMPPSYATVLCHRPYVTFGDGVRALDRRTRVMMTSANPPPRLTSSKAMMPSRVIMTLFATLSPTAILEPVGAMPVAFTR
jgi:hypothetical protein